MNIEFAGEIDAAGKLTLYQPDLLKQWCRSNTGKKISLSVSIKKKRRSNEQNGYYWVVVVPMITEAMNELGNDFSKEETHDLLKKEFNYKEVETNNGHYIKVPRSTSILTTVEFNTYKERIQQFASEMLGIYIPDPNEAMTINFPQPH